MNKIVKRITAMATTAMMVASISAISASSTNYNVTSTNPKSYDDFIANTSRQYSVSVTIGTLSVNNAIVTCDGFVSRGGVWYYIVQTTVSGKGNTSTNTGTWYQISKGDKGRNTISVDYGKSTGSTLGF